MSVQRWKHYIPAALLLASAWLFAAVPALAVLIVSGALVFFGLLYASIVYKVHRAQDSAPPPGVVDAEFYRGEPNFKNVTVHFARRVDWFKPTV
ncbi:MAG: hypothetical protein H6617_01340 [Bdellovibrionaceae bacterium]|nr:hypothetical protein [Bdellovibrionales bacterium]MCB9253309.1 hypothetical protein [Pseudobdellovibrionaceae bacterium]